MNQAPSTVNRYLYAFLLLTWFFPFIQDQFRFFHFDGLKGAFQQVKMPAFTWASFADGEFGEQMERYQNQHNGFRPLFVRNRNQVHYTLLNQIFAPNVVIAKNRYLYETHYIHARTGHNFIGNDSVRYHCERFRKVKETLAAKGIHMLVVLAPGKGWFYPEYLPDTCHLAPLEQTNYGAYTTAFRQAGISCIDFNSWFLQLKGKKPYPIYTKLGIHWSSYGSALCADSFTRYLQQWYPQCTTVEPDSMTLQPYTRSFDDADLYNLLNLHERFPDEPATAFAYPTLKTRPGTQHPKALFIGDSFFWNWTHLHMPKTVFDSTSQFWYYGKSSYGIDQSYDPRDIQELNWKEEVERSQMVIFICTEANLPVFPFGFIDQACNTYHLN